MSEARKRKNLKSRQQTVARQGSALSRGSIISEPEASASVICALIAARSNALSTSTSTPAWKTLPTPPRSCRRWGFLGAPRGTAESSSSLPGAWRHYRLPIMRAAPVNTDSWHCCRARTPACGGTLGSFRDGEETNVARAVALLEFLAPRVTRNAARRKQPRAVENKLADAIYMGMLCDC
ncbi:hypothetical protein MTO96_005283 [Rhipicephalus appendiculatus]